MYQKIRKTCLYVSTTLLGFLLAAAAHADSAKLMWSGNGHYYQRFDLRNVSWASSKSRCESLGGHLASITSVNEDGFIQANFIVPKNTTFIRFHLGGINVTGQWKWITGEAWGYSNWYDNSTYANGLMIAANGRWVDSRYDSFTEGYICEWSGNNFLGSTVVKDINGNGVSEFAALYQDAKTAAHTVLIKDSGTQALLGKLTFPAATKASQGVVALKNIQTSNTTPEIGVLINTSTGIVVQIKDIKNNVTLISTIPFLDRNYQARSITAVPDINANGADEIAVLGSNISGKAKMEMRDSKTKAVLRTVLY